MYDFQHFKKTLVRIACERELKAFFVEILLCFSNHYFGLTENIFDTQN